jgi:demethylmenaquinone methyltransferase/2-methoxy-6-polyprenyl-1,4-benzoquinol methylase
MALAKNQILELYRRRAGNYDLSANLYYLIGFREAKYRKMAVAALKLRPGDAVVELGCGTGLNFGYLADAVGGAGRIIGVDLTDAMLEKARQRIAKKGWRNVSVVQSDAAEYEFPPDPKGVISTFALTLVPEYEQVIGRVAQVLAPGGRLVVLDFKKPSQWPPCVFKFGVWITHPFGVSLDLAERKPWTAMTKYFPDVSLQECYGGFVYIATGVKPSAVISANQQ